MFCPKCGTQNADEARFCRGCGADLGNVLAIVDGKVPAVDALAVKRLDVQSSGLRNLIAGIGFLIVSGVSFAISIRLAVLGVFALAFAFVFLSAGISRMVQANGLKRLGEPKKDDEPKTLAEAQTEYIKPIKSIYETDELSRRMPGSVTDHTTRHLELDPDDTSKS